jgi:hypothetical protein
MTMTLRGAARFFGVTHRTLKNWLVAAGMPPQRAGHLRLVNLNEIEPVVAARLSKPIPPKETT